MSATATKKQYIDVLLAFDKCFTKTTTTSTPQWLANCRHKQHSDTGQKPAEAVSRLRILRPQSGTRCLGSPLPPPGTPPAMDRI